MKAKTTEVTALIRVEWTVHLGHFEVHYRDGKAFAGRVFHGLYLKYHPSEFINFTGEVSSSTGMSVLSCFPCQTKHEMVQGALRSGRPAPPLEHE